MKIKTSPSMFARLLMAYTLVFLRCVEIRNPMLDRVAQVIVMIITAHNSE